MIVLLCPCCNEPMLEADAVGVLRLRCRSRHCRDKPRVTWQVTRERAVKLAMDVDRRAPVGVE